MPKYSAEYDYAVDLAVHLWEEFYKDEVPEFEPLEDVMGVLTQIDNMTAGLKDRINA